MSRGPIFHPVNKKGQEEKTWTVRYEAPPDPETGKRREVWKRGFVKYGDAKKWLNEQLAAIDKGEHVTPSKMKLTKYLRDEWLPGMRASVRPGTYDSYELLCRKYIIPRLGGIELQSLTTGRIKAFYNNELLLSGGADGGPLAGKTVRNVAAVLHCALEEAAALSYIPRNPATKAKLPARNQPEMQTWNEEQVRAFLATVAVDHGQRGSEAAERRLFAAWRLMLTTGMRRGEVIGLRWSDVSPDLGRLQITSTRVRAAKGVTTGPPKTDAGRRYIALDPTTVAALKAWRKYHREHERMPIGPRYIDSGLVFVNPDGSGITPNRLSIWFRSAAKRSGLPAIRLHDLRHTYATIALRRGTPVKVVSARLGHASIAITLDLYAHALPQDDESAAGSIEAAYE